MAGAGTRSTETYPGISGLSIALLLHGAETIKPVGRQFSGGGHFRNLTLKLIRFHTQEKLYNQAFIDPSEKRVVAQHSSP